MMKNYVILLVFLLTSCENIVSESASHDTNLYLTYQVSFGKIRDIIPTTGNFELEEQVIVGSEISGKIIEVLVETNDLVKSGDLLAIIDPKPFLSSIRRVQADIEISSASIRRLEFELEKIEAQYLRRKDKQEFLGESTETIDNLRYDVSVKKTEIEEAEFRLRKDKARLEVEKFNLSKTKIFSPIDGFVIERKVNQGNNVNANLTNPELFIVATARNSMHLKSQISELDVTRVTNGMIAQIKAIGLPNKTMRGQVVKIELSPVKKGNFVTYNTTIKIENPLEEILPGMSASAELVNVDIKSVPRFPVNALYFKPHDYIPDIHALELTEAEIPYKENNRAARYAYLNGYEVAKYSASGKRRIFVLKNGQLKSVPVTVVAETDEWVGILEADLEIGASVILGYQ